MDKVLILGAKGMLGQALVRAFHDAEVFAWDREECDITETSQVQRNILKLSEELFSRSDKKLFNGSSDLVVINAAAYNDVDGAEKNATLANTINGNAVGYLAKAAASVGAIFAHYSTDYVFDGKKRDGYREDDPPNPLSAYGRSKLLGEQRIKHQASSIKHWYLIRTSRLFGKPGNGKKSFVDTMLDLAQKKDTLEVVDEEVSSPTYAEDLAARTREIIEQKKTSGIYHVTNAGACTWYEFAQEIFRQANEIQGASLHASMPLVTPVPSSRFPRPAKRPAYSQLLNTKLPPMRSWQEALRAYLTHDFSRV